VITATTHARRAVWLAPTWRTIKKHWLVYLLGVVLPVALFLVFVGYPLVYTVYLSFMDWNGLSAHITFVGLSNFVELVQDGTFWLSFANTVKWTAGTLLFADVFAFLLAVFLRSNKIYFGSLCRALLFLPVTMSLVAVGIMFSFILSPGFGALGVVLQAIGLGIQNPDLLGNSSTVTYTLIALFGWSYLGIPLMLFDAGITQIPGDLYEAAAMEGATDVQTLWHITIPMLRPIFMVVTMLAVIEALRAFDLVVVMTKGGPGNASNVLGYFMYITAFDETRLGYGASVSTVILVLSAAFAIVYLRRVGSEVLA